MDNILRKLLPACLLSAAAVVSLPTFAQDKTLNLYSSRHYSTDEALYANFTKLTGIRINRIEGPEDALLERIKNEGAASPADVLARLVRTRISAAASTTTTTTASTTVRRTRSSLSLMRHRTRR